uniref:EF-hand domain-containing protein n=1 Tax=Spumella elongata TaxID=89044 RepID=A0A7S3GNE7_9STRA
MSPRRIVRGNSALHTGGPSMRDLLHSPQQPMSAPQPRERPAGRLPRTYSAQSLDAPPNGASGAHNPDVDLMHTDMRSNFRLMKDLRAEMLQEEKNLAISSHAAEPLHPTTPGGAAISKFLGSLKSPSNHGKARSEMPPMPPKIVSTVSMDIELGGPAVQEIHEMEIAQGIDEDFEGHVKPHRKRERTFSLAYVAPGPNGVVNRHSSKTFKERQYEHMSLCEKFFFNVRACGVSLYHRMVNALLGHHIGHEEAEIDADIADLQEDFTHIFLFRSAEFYYFTVEFCLLAQCVYLALWATNFVFIANDSYYPVLWNIALLVPVPINFLLSKQIIFTSVMLKSIVTLDKYVADKICEEAVDERNVKHRVRKVIRTALRTLEIPRDTWQQFTMDQFELYIPDNDVGLNMANLKLFLHSLQIFLTDATVKRIFTVLDFDKDEKLVWEEIMPIVFPELVRKQVKLNRQRRASASFDYQIEGELVTAEEKKEVQRKTRKQKRASMVTETGFGGNNLSDTEKIPSAEEGNKRHSTSRDRKNNRRTPTPDTTIPTPTPHIEDELKSDASDYGDESSESSFNSHDDISSSEGSGDEMQDPNGDVQCIHSEADIDVALLDRLSLSHKSRNGQRAAELTDLNNRSGEKMSLEPRSSDDSDEKQKSVRFSKFFDV